MASALFVGMAAGVVEPYSQVVAKSRAKAESRLWGATCQTARPNSASWLESILTNFNIRPSLDLDIMDIMDIILHFQCQFSASTSP